MNKVLQNENLLYRSSDIALCSALRCLNYQIERIEKDNPSKVVFVIKKDERLEDLIKSFFAHQLKVDALGYFNSLKELKTQIYNV